MRVLEASPASKPIMGKKKHKLRKQNRENEQCLSDSSDEARDPGMPGEYFYWHVYLTLNVRGPS